MPDLVLGRGKLFFGETFGGPEFYLGSSAQFAVTHSVEVVKTFKSVNGVLVTDEVFIRSSSMSARCVIDHISTDNMARYFGASTERTVYEAVYAQQETREARRGAIYQIGVCDAFPFGVKNVLSLSVSIGNLVLIDGEHFDFNPATGVLQMRTRISGFLDGADMLITFTAGGSTPSVLKVGSNFLSGCLRYEEDNQVGKNRTFVFPQARLLSSGDEVDMKADTWRQLPLTIEPTAKSVSGTPLFIVENVSLNNYGMPSSDDRVDAFGNLDTDPPRFRDNYGVN